MSKITNQGETFYVPLQFWFSNSPSMTIPYVALQYSNIHFNITFNSLNDIIVNVPEDSDIQYPPGTEIAQLIPGFLITAHFPNPEFQMEDLQEGLRDLMLGGENNLLMDYKSSDDDFLG